MLTIKIPVPIFDTVSVSAKQLINEPIPIITVPASADILGKFFYFP